MRRARAWWAVLAVGAAACATTVRHEVVVVAPPEPPLRGYATGPLSLGEAPGELTAAQINAALAGYGTWFDSPAYGRVWRPDDLAATFAPYATAGRWLPTDAGWYWQSDYAWGRVAFHYGRWALDGGRWCWVPGSRFAPAWVDWRAGGGWVGWSALGPVGAAPRAPYVYCPHDRLGDPDLDARLVRGAAGSSLYGRTAPVTGDGDAPRGPTITVGSFVSVARAWGAPAAAPRRPPAITATAGVDTVERVPAARVVDATTVEDPPVGGAAVVIRDRDLAGMAEGPSVRRPAGTAILPDRVIPRRPAAAATAPAAGPPTVAIAAPPPLPPPPDGVGAAGFVGAYPARPAAAFAGRRAAVAAPAVVASPPVAAPAAATAPGRAGVSTGAWLGGAARGAEPAATPRPVEPLATVQ